MKLPPYIDALLEAWHHGYRPPYIHLGYWPEGKQGELSEAQQWLVDLMLDGLQIKPEQRIADIACGFGGIINYLNSTHQQLELHGLNIDQRQLHICQGINAAHGNKLQWHLADAVKLPFADNSLDHIICCEAMFHFSSRKKFLRECLRVLADNATLTTADILINPPQTNKHQAAITAIQNYYGPWPEPVVTVEQYLNDYRAEGFSVELTDISAQTQTTYDYIAPSHMMDFEQAEAPSIQAILAMRWLHSEGVLKYILMKGVSAGSL